MRLNLVYLVLLIISFGSCKEQETKYLTSPSGLQYTYHKQLENGVKANEGDYLKVFARFSNLADSSFSFQPITFILDTAALSKQMYEALNLVREGDSVSFLLNVDDFYEHYSSQARPELIYNDSLMKLTISVLDILDAYAFNLERLEEEDKNIERFLANRQWDMEYDSATGIYYEIVVKNPEGTKIEYGDQVGIAYNYYTILEKPLSRIKEGDLWPFIIGDKQIRPGISKAISFCREGEYIRAIIPYEQAFGADGLGALVAPYTTLVLEADVPTVTKAKDIEIDILN